MNSDNNTITKPSERLIDRVINSLKHHMVQAGTVIGITDIHAWTLTHRIQSFKNLDAV